MPENIDSDVPVCRSIKTIERIIPSKDVHREICGRDRKMIPTRSARQNVMASVVSGRNFARLKRA
jgi:hypothetical protein